MKSFLTVASFIFFLSNSFAQEYRFDPPWNSPPESAVNFTIPGIDNVPDLYGDINDPQLVVFFAGNQFMVVDDLFDAFKEHYPQYTRIFAETLPPGKLAEQLEGGSLTIGNMRISLKPDIYTAGSGKIEELKDKFEETAPYTTNRLAIMVSKGNPMGISGLKDLSSPTLKISMPNPKWEGIGKQIEKAYIKAGGEELRAQIMEKKVDDGSTYLTQIHHRQTPMRILYGESEAGPVWYTEVFYQQLLGHPISMVEIPENENVQVTYVAGKLKNAPHKEAASDFMDFLTSPIAKAIYKKYGFGEVQ